ncbi:GLUTAMINE DUMPER 4 protein [Nymphaea thermarum]|nr:GLUTAMINE DUMPER 4 protein [Nymphaea thermarum]
MRPESREYKAGGLTAPHSPNPYLFGGLGIMLFLIAFALIMLACSNQKDADQESGDELPEKPKNVKSSTVDMEPRIVVIMAGDEKPTFIAKPSSSVEGMLADQKNCYSYQIMPKDSLQRTHDLQLSEIDGYSVLPP